jgi:hypothetical protein
LQPPSAQVPPSHEVPHAPQFLASKRVFTQAVPHAWRRGPHEQTPAEQIEPAAHAFPQLPQSTGLFFVSTQCE